MEPYDHSKIEKKWQEHWANKKLYEVSSDTFKPKYYILDMFPYPSGAGLHVGHPRGYIATDVYSRMKRMQGFNVLHPMGWDAFGLPAENYAIKTKTHPRDAVAKNVARYKEQLSMIGFDYDWSREVNTTDPEYYKWTQWTFIQMFKKGLVYRSNEPINWCPRCQTGLANEDLDQGVCERCGSDVEQKAFPQWVIKITDYAERLLGDLDTLPDWPSSVKESQRNWIGKSEGAEIDFAVAGSSESIRVFTTRPDTIYGATYIVLAPEHPLVDRLEMLSNKDEVLTYRTRAQAKTEIERTREDKEKKGVRLEGVTAINPATHEEISVWVSDYVLMNYGTGAIMAVPAHDERDGAFAEAYNLPVVEVVDEEGSLVNSGEFTGHNALSSMKPITEACGGEMVTRYRLRDWVFARQRYWGEPIPIIHCPDCGAVPVPEEDLPVLLPEVEHYEPTGTGKSPLAGITDWVTTTCPVCSKEAERETDTMPQWAGSSWYYLRYIDPDNSEALIDRDKEKNWMPVDVYVGGVEHATRHLIYARFWHKFLFDIGVVSTSEPFALLRNQGLILAPDGRKMSKRYGNTINPDDVVESVGADALRLYEMFIAPFENTTPWSEQGLAGTRRLLEKVWRQYEKVTDTPNVDLEPLLHKTIKKVSEDILRFHFNTAVSEMMICMNAFDGASEIGKNQYVTFLKILAPFAPHMAEELWHQLGNATSIHLESWPEYDKKLVVDDEVTLAVQVNGKVRAQVTVAKNADEATVKEAALGEENVQKFLEGGEIKKFIYVPGKIVNIVV